ncbi:alpha-D-ribose 1-methylphosphonate 5-triphosphate diphosphatase [Paragemmobacter straminiformis]|uniref:Alpha-D-ribose 1-methylphosphonate 5-triphosphate diphosphatase n=1 Tax=Paragemmobacter straminiformis TaxID=2045119 RepID=A0A842ID42_9RHOB|nr:alpha-D-ribose 1-methylphosphonate 5-triphosphate diphosphatase [Gemmobacter straminiformis]MBC2836868.1 alpha-D-ribose 1-methylphosphonate 5-triphosphate diphosphatase [Gemmobacter straminiformis]
MPNPAFLPPLRFTGAEVLREGRLGPDAIAVAEGLLTDAAAPEIDLSGFLVLPGIIDLHGDGFERQMFPRPTAPFPVASGLAATDREAAAHGVTTAYLAQSWSWEGGHRGPEQAEALLAALEGFEAATDLRVQIRAETHLVEAAPRLLEVVERYGVDYVIFNDHLEEGFQMRRGNPDGFAHWARKAGLAEDALFARMEAARARTREVPRSLCALANGFDRLGVTYGSHDDPDAETREFYAMIGARVAEFPTTRKAAMAARPTGSPIIMGAPNVVRGGSQAGNISAAALLRDGLCDVLVSDYHIPALPLAVWRLVDEGLALSRAWALISSNAADALRMADRGRIAAGLRADLVVVNAATRQVEATIAGGRLAYLSGEAGRRFMAQPQAMRMAAE